MNPIKVKPGGRASWTLIAGVAALIVAGCGSSGGGSGSGGQSGTGGRPSASGGSAPGTGGASSGSGGASSGSGGSSTIGTGGDSSGSGGSVAATGGTTAGTGGGSVAGRGGNASATGGRGAGVGGGGGMAASTGGGTGQGGRAGLTLTSTALTNGATFLPANTCAGIGQSPPLTWTAGPTGTQSYAIVLLDMANTRYHWAIWNIPATVMTLPEALPAGASITTPVMALQAITGAGTPAYQGPCPSGNLHTYIFTVYALDVATLPGVANGVMAQAVSTAIQSHVLASGTLSGTSDASRP